jgi:hypothetical protein
MENTSGKSHGILGNLMTSSSSYPSQGRTIFYYFIASKNTFD